MSTIHSALTRAQQEKDARKGPFPGSGNPDAPFRSGKGKRVLQVLAGIALVFILGYAGFLAANRSPEENAGKKPAVQASGPGEPQEKENAPPFGVMDQNGQPLAAGERPAQGTLIAKAEKRPGAWRTGKDPKAMSGSLAASQETGGAQEDGPEAMPGEPGGKQGAFRRERAWRMAQERENFRGFPGLNPRRGASGDAVEEDMEEPEEIIEDLELPEEADPPAIIASRWYDKGLNSQMLGRLEEARAYYTRSLDEDPTYAPSLNNRAVIDMGYGKMEAAREGFTQAMNADPVYVDPCYNLACLHARQGNLEEALSFLNTAVNMDKAVLEWAREDKDLAVLQDMDEFKEVMND